LLAGSIGNAAAAAAYAADIAWRLAWLVATMGVILAVLDFVVARHAWLISHRMSRADIQREARETAGDPEMKARRREAHQHMMRSADYDTENRERKP
jgi:flagellar biosynthesis protein FlhB